MRIDDVTVDTGAIADDDDVDDNDDEDDGEDFMAEDDVVSGDFEINRWSDDDNKLLDGVVELLSIIVSAADSIVCDCDDKYDVCVVIGAATTGEAKATQTKENITVYSENKCM